MEHPRASADHHHEAHGHGPHASSDHQHGAGDTDEAALADLVDLDAEVLHEYLSQVTAWVKEVSAGLEVRTILDLGSGTGTGTLALLPTFERARAVAVDISDHMLERLRVKARDLGLADRLRTVRADLDAQWPEVGRVDLVWASSSMHHMADPDRVLARVLAALAPGGLVVVAEMNSFPRFLPDDLGFGRPGLEARIHAVVDEARALQLPTFGSDWGARLSATGFAVEAGRDFTVELTPPLPVAAARYARASLGRLRAGLAGRLSADDAASLDILLDDAGPTRLMHRGDLSVRTVRPVWVATRP